MILHINVKDFTTILKVKYWILDTGSHTLETSSLKIISPISKETVCVEKGLGHTTRQTSDLKIAGSRTSDIPARVV